MRLQMTVDAVVGDVGQTILEPFDRHLALKRGVFDLGIGLEPVDTFAVLAPELLSGSSMLSSYHLRYLSSSISACAFADFSTGLVLADMNSSHVDGPQLATRTVLPGLSRLFISGEIQPAIRQRSFASWRIAISLHSRYKDAEFPK